MVLVETENNFFNFSNANVIIKDDDGITAHFSQLATYHIDEADSVNLDELELYLPRFEIDTNNFNPKKLISLINPKIKKLELLCGYSKDRIDDAHKIYNLCLDSLKELESLRMKIVCIDSPALKYNNKIEGAYDKARRKRNSEATKPILIDFSKIKKIKNLKKIDIDIDAYFGIKTLNTIEIANCNHLSDVKLSFNYRDYKIDIKELSLIFDKISTERQKFLLKKNKDKAYKDKDLIEYRYELNEDDKEKYDNIENQDTRSIKINGKDLSTTIFNTYKKKIN